MAIDSLSGKEQIPFSHDHFYQSIVPSFLGVANLSPCDPVSEDADPSENGIPCYTAVALKQVFERVLQIPQDSCQKKTFLKIVQILCDGTDDWSRILLAYDIAARILSGERAGQALAVVGVRMVRAKKYCLIPELVHRIFMTGVNVRGNLLLIEKEIYNRKGVSFLLEQASFIKTSVEKIESLVAIALAEVNKGQITPAEKIVEYIDGEISQMGMSTPEIDAMVKEVECSLLVENMADLGFGNRPLDEDVKIYFRISKLIKKIADEYKFHTLCRIDLDLNEVVDSYEQWISLPKQRKICTDLAKIAISEGKFDAVLKLGDIIKNQVHGDYHGKRVAIVEIAKHLVKLDFSNKVDYIAKLLTGNDSDFEIDASLLYDVVCDCNESEKIEIAMNLAEKLMNEAQFECFCKFMSNLLVSAGKFSLVSELFKRLDTSHHGLKLKLVISISSWAGIKDLNKVLKKVLMPLQDSGEFSGSDTCLQTVKMVAQLAIEAREINWKAENVRPLFESTIRNTPSLWIWPGSAPHDPISQDTYEFMAQILIDNGNLKQAEEIIINHITDEASLSRLSSMLALEQCKKSL